MIDTLFIKHKHFLFRYFYLFSLTASNVICELITMQCIYVQSAIYAEYLKKIFYVTNCGSDNCIAHIEQQREQIVDYLARNGVCGYTLHTLNIAATYTPELLAQRNNPLFDAEAQTIRAEAATLAAIVDVDYTQEGKPVAEVLLSEIPSTSTEEQLISAIYGLLNNIIRIEKEYNRHTTEGVRALHFRVQDIECDEQEFIAADFLSRDNLNRQTDAAPSPLLIDDNFNIRLLQYPQVTIELAPLPKALYILLLLHPEGFVLKEIMDYAPELRCIYRTISGRQNISVLNKMLDSITNPTANPLHKNLSIIRRAFLSKLRCDIAECYIPTHGRNSIHRIPLERSLIELPPFCIAKF